MENFFNIIIPLILMVLSLISFLLTIFYDKSPKSFRKKIVNNWIFWLMLSIFYPLLLPNHYLWFFVLAMGMCVFYSFYEQEIKKIFFSLDWF